MPRILIIDDDERIRASLVRVLGRTPRAKAAAVDSAEKALEVVGRDAPDLVISDVRMPGMDGLELLRLIRERAPSVDVILMTAYDDLSTVSTAMRDGAIDLLVKPLDLHQLRLVVEQALADRRARAAGQKEAEGRAADAVQIVGHDPAVVEVFKRVGQASASDIPVLIRGESGTGKELVARAIHQGSDRANEPFVPVDCTSVPASLLESELFGHVKGAFTGASRDRRGRLAQAGKGTVFLDEVGDTTPDFQAKLLRVVQEREFTPVGADRSERLQARLISATHRDLEEMADEGTFRQDLYYRLRVLEISVPPLRERMADIAELAEFFVGKASRAAGRKPPVFSPDAREALLAHDWPGNVRELENAIARAVVLTQGSVIRAAHLRIGRSGGAPAASSPDGFGTLAEMERDLVQRVLAATDGNKTRAAEVLDISRARLRRILERRD